MMLLTFLFAASVGSSPATSQDPHLTVRVEQARNDRGRMLAAVYDSPAGFPGGGHPTRTGSAPIVGGRAQIPFELPPGVYAIVVVHDENDNHKLDTGFFGIPSEGIGASNDGQGRFGPARFEKAKLFLDRDTTIDIRLVYF